MKEIKVKKDYVAPEQIEARSMAIITRELGDRELDPKEAPIIKRVIHTTADFDFAENIVFSENAVTVFQEAIKKGVTIVTDTEMARAGINKKRLLMYDGHTECYMSRADVAAEAKARGITRAAVSMEKAASLKTPVIFAIGNAPTALIKLHELMEEGRISPAGIIAVPVGFVNVVEAKELILSDHAPYIVARGRKGGSPVAAAIVNALLYTLS